MEKLQECLVKGVLSGDTVILSGKMKKNSEEAPEEKILYLSLISAPRCGSSNNLEEEPFGWDSRDYLRQQVLGKVVKYNVDYKNNEKLYGQLVVDGKNMNQDLVKNGYAKVGFLPKNEPIIKTDYLAKLQSAEAEAKKAKKNMWSDNQSVLATHKRNLQSANDVLFDSADFLKFAKDKELDVMVDYVINCAFYVVFIKELNTFIKMNIRFVAIPSSKDPVLYIGGKAYVERIILHKDIKAVIHGVDSEKNFLGDLIEKKGSMAGHILKNGYSKLFINNSTPYTSDELSLMKEAQKLAKKGRLRMWKNEKGSDGEGDSKVKEKSGKKSSEFEGICIQVHSGDSVSVKNNKSGEVIRVFLSHVKAPKLARPNSDESDQPWAWQAKEFLRKILVGKKVRCEFDYSKTIEKDDKVMNFYSVFRTVESRDVKESGKEKNVNVELIEPGYATFINPKMDDENISKYLDSYQVAEKTAKEKKVGIHSLKYPGNPNYADLISANKSKKKESIGFLINQKNLNCVVEYCFSASKFKLRIDKSKAYVSFSLLGVKTFGKDKNTLEVHEKFFKQGVDYVNEHILQREGTCDIIAADRIGNYFGYLVINGANFGTTLIKEGLAVVSSQSNNPIVFLNEFKNAEKEAEKNGKNIWAVDNLASFLKEGEFVANLPNKFEEQHTDVTLRVTDYVDFHNFYVNILPNKKLENIESVLLDYETGASKTIPLEFPVRVGTLCAARYVNDDHIYRAKISKTLKDGKFEVEFIDYGTVDICTKNDLFKLDNSIALVEPQSLFCELAYLKYSQNSMKKALEKITDFVNLDLQLPGKICYTYNQDGRAKFGVLIYKNKEKKVAESHHGTLIKVGYAKLDAKKTLPDYLKDLKEVESKTEKLGVGLWAENEATDYDENDGEEF